MKRVVFIIAKEDFRDEELFTPLSIVKEHAQTHIASTETGVCHGKRGGTATAELNIQDVAQRFDEFDAIIFVGGSGARTFFIHDGAQNLARRAHKEAKLLGAICIAPRILARAGVLSGVKATVWDNEQQESTRELREHGALVQSEPVVVDKHIVTANGPHAAHAFGETIVRLLQ